MVGCGCQVCSSADLRDKRTRASLLIQHDGKTILVDTSSDLRQQVLRERVEKIDAVFFTHSHADHVNGIDDLRGFYFLHKEIIPCYASRSSLDTLQAGFGYIFHEQENSGYTPLLVPHEVSAPFELFGLHVTPVPLVHGYTTSLGYRIGSFAYLTDCSAIPDSSLPLLEGVDLLIIDALRWSGHPFHYNIEGAIAAAEKLNASRVILTHLTHEVSYSEGGKLPPGFEFAFDGMEFDMLYPDFKSAMKSE